MEPNNNNSNTNYPTFQESQIEQSNPLGAYSDSPALTPVRSTKNLPSFQNKGHWRPNSYKRRRPYICTRFELK